LAAEERMLYLILGLLVWMSAHMLKRVAPGLREDLDKSFGRNIPRFLISLVLTLSLVLMFIGYRRADFISIYTPIDGAGHLNNVIMLVALFLMGVGAAGGRLSAKMRHPMLWGVILWAFAHLIVNGDLASLILFGGLGAWAVLQIQLINGHEGPWERPKPGDALSDWKLALTTLFLFVLIAGIHWLFNHNPFLGTYP
jgi:uncharacterized membrane protein